MTRPRSKGRKNWPANLIARKKNGGLYYSWRHPETKQETGLGYDYADAARESIRANLVLAAIEKPKISLAEKLEGKTETKMSEWLVQFKMLLDKRPGKKKGGGKRAESTRREDDKRIKVLLSHFGDKPVDKITTKDCAAIILKFQNSGHDQTAYLYKGFMNDCFSEAEAAGLIPRGTNPASIVTAQKPRTKRARLDIDTFNKMVEKADRFLKTGMQLALITGQRVSDVAKMRYDDIEANKWLKVEQTKTHQRIKIPLDIDLQGVTLRSVIKDGRKIVGAQHIVHKWVAKGGTKAGTGYCDRTFSHGFTKLITTMFKDKWPGDTHPTFHEIRALSKKMHKERGIDTLSLLGHDDESTARIYDDPRAGWVEVQLKNKA